VGEMTDRPRDDEEPVADHPWSRAPEAAESEPEWAAEIRERRKARGDRLRQIFDTFGDEKKESDT
jgi:hypothetical protein